MGATFSKSKRSCGWTRLLQGSGYWPPQLEPGDHESAVNHISSSARPSNPRTVHLAPEYFRFCQQFSSRIPNTKINSENCNVCAFYPLSLESHSLWGMWGCCLSTLLFTGLSHIHSGWLYCTSLLVLATPKVMWTKMDHWEDSSVKLHHLIPLNQTSICNALTFAKEKYWLSCESNDLHLSFMKELLGSKLLQFAHIHCSSTICHETIHKARKN